MSRSKYYNKDWNSKSGPPLCAFFLRRGSCKYEADCKFSHDKSVGDENKVPLCKFWLEGDCKFGDGCTFRHSTMDLEALTARYNAQLMNQASQGLEWVYHPDFGMTLAAPSPDLGIPIPVPNVNVVGPMYPAQPTYTQYPYPGGGAAGVMPHFPPPHVSSVVSYPPVPNSETPLVGASVILPSAREPSIPGQQAPTLPYVPTSVLASNIQLQGNKPNQKPEKRRRERDSHSPVNVCQKRVKLAPRVRPFIEIPSAVSVAGD